MEFATTWPSYDLDSPTRTLLEYTSKLTETPYLVSQDDTDALRQCGWSESVIWEITALISLFNMSRRMEAAAGLSPDEIPEIARMAEARSV